jgi:hypothetical protein
VVHFSASIEQINNLETTWTENHPPHPIAVVNLAEALLKPPVPTSILSGAQMSKIGPTARQKCPGQPALKRIWQLGICILASAGGTMSLG